MTPEERRQAVAAWRELRRRDPKLADELEPWVRQFGLGGIIVVWFDEPTPPRPRTARPDLERLIAADPERARQILDLLEDEPEEPPANLRRPPGSCSLCGGEKRACRTPGCPQVPVTGNRYTRR